MKLQMNSGRRAWEPRGLSRKIFDELLKKKIKKFFYQHNNLAAINSRVSNSVNKHYTLSCIKRAYVGLFINTMGPSHAPVSEVEEKINEILGLVSI